MHDNDTVVTFEIVAEDSTATQPGDFTLTGPTATIDATMTTGNISIDIADDAINEAVETFTVRLVSSPSASISDTANEVVVTITDDDAVPVIDLSLPTANDYTEGGEFDIQVDIFDDSTATPTPITTTASSREIEVHYMITDSTMADFIAEEDEISSIMIPANTRRATKSIDIQNNFVDRDGSDITIKLLDDSGTATYTKSATEAKNTKMATIVDNDDGPVIQVTRDPNSAINEGSSAVFEYSIVSDSTNTTTSSAGDIEIQVGITETTGDYINPNTPSPRTVTLSAGETSVYDAVATTDDTDDEANGAITVTVQADVSTNSTPHYIPDATNNNVVVMVNDDDAPDSGGAATTVAFTIASPATTPDATVDEDDGMVDLEITRTGVMTDALEVTYTTAISGIGTDHAVTGNDFTAPDGGTGTVIFPANSATTTISIPILQDTIDEADETFVVSLVNPATITDWEISNDSSATVTITDDDAAPVIQVSRSPNSAVDEGESATFTYSIETDGTNTTASSSRDISIRVNVSDTGSTDKAAGSAGFVADDTDATAVSKMITLAAGTTSVSDEITIVDDDTEEPNGSITLTILDDSPTSPAVALYTKSTANDSVDVLVFDNSAPAGTGQIVSFTETERNVAEDVGTVSLTIEVEEDAAADIVVTFITSFTGDGVGFVDADDFTALADPNDKATITMGTKTATLDITIDDDTVLEPTETLIVEISAVAGNDTFSTTGSKAEITITDNEAAPVITVERDPNPAVEEGGEVEFTYNADVISYRDIEIQVELDKTSGEFFTSDQELSKVVILPAGEMSVTDTITTDNDKVFEDDGSFTLTVLADVSTNDPAHYTVGAANNVVVDVTDNEAAPVIELSLVADQTIEEGGSFEIMVDIVADEATATSSTASSAAIEVELSITDHATSDFIADTDESVTITIAAGETSASTEIDILASSDNTIHGDSGQITVALADDAGKTAYSNSEEAGKDSVMVDISDNDAPPVIEISLTPDQTITEGGNVEIQVDIVVDEENTTTESADATTVLYTITDPADNFFADADKLAAATTIDIPAGANTATKTIGLETNTIHREASEVTIALAADSETVATYNVSPIGPKSEVKFNVVDDDAPPVISISTAATSPATTIAEGGTFDITVTIKTDTTLTPPISTTGSGEVIKVHYSITDSDLEDFIADADEVSSIDIPVGMNTATATIDIQENTIDNRDNGTITVTLLDDGVTTRYTKSETAAENTSEVTIVDDDAAPVIQSSRTATTPVEEGDSAEIMFSVFTDPAAGTPVTTTAAAQPIEIQVGITENSGDYFGIASGSNTTTLTVTLPAGETSVTGITPLEDTVDEVDGEFSVLLADDTNTDAHYTTSSPTAITVTVNDDDAAPIIEIVRSENTAINKTVGTAEYTVQIDPNSPTTGSDQDITVAISATDSGGEFLTTDPTSASAMITSGSTSATTTITADGTNTSGTTHGSIIVSVSADDGSTSAGRYSVSSTNSSVTTSVIDTDLATTQAATLKFMSSEVTIAETATEGMVELTVELTGTAVDGSPITVDYVIQSTGSAVAGTDFTAPASDANTLTFTYAESAPVTMQTIQIPILVDTIAETNETFKVVLVNFP